MKQKTLASNIFLCLMVFMFMVCSVHASSVNLGTAGNFAILSKSGVTDVPSSSIIGNVGTTPITGAAIGVSCTEVTGTIYDNDGFYTGGYDSNVLCRLTNAGLLNTARIDMEAAYTSASNQVPPVQTGLGSGDISGMILTTPGIYKWTTGLLINSGIAPDANGVTLDCGGDTNAVFIFQVGQTLTVGSGAVVTLSNGCQAKNVFWAVAGQTTLGTYSIFNGDILDQTKIAMQTGARLCGRTLAQTEVTLDHNYISTICGNIIEINTTSLNITKVVINDDGGTKNVSDFTLLINGYSVLSGIANAVVPGTYNVSEIAVLGYSGTISGDCSSGGTVILNSGEHKTCIITNNDVPLLPNSANLTVTKIVINDEGGIAVVSDFILLINGSSVLSGIPNAVAPGTYVVSEIGLPGYNATISGDCSPDGTVTLTTGQNKNCTITNNDVPPLPNSPRLIVTKIVINDDGGTKNVSNFPLKVGNVSVVSGVQYIFTAGTYLVSEVVDPMYNPIISGDCSINGTVSLNPGDVKACTITNNDIRIPKPVPIMDNKLFILLAAFTLTLGLYGFKKYGR